MAAHEQLKAACCASRAADHCAVQQNTGHWLWEALAQYCNVQCVPLVYVGRFGTYVWMVAGVRMNNTKRRVGHHVLGGDFVDVSGEAHPHIHTS